MKITHRISGALVGLTLLAAPAAASDGKQAAAQAVEAAPGLQRYATEVAAAGGRMDLLKGPDADHLLRVFDEASFAALPAPGSPDLHWPVDWFGALRTANYSILYFGADPKRMAEVSPEQISRNIADYEDQLATATVFMHDMFPRVMATAVGYISRLPENERNLPVRPEGVGKLRAGYAESMERSPMVIASGGGKTRTIRAITTALRQNAEASASLATPEDRGRLARLIATVRDKAGDAQSFGNLRAMLGSLESK